MIEERRRLIELCVAAARKRQRKQTGFVHHCYESVAELEHDTIPLYENICFVLGLFRTKSSENIAEGKILLEKLLAFLVEGNFPIYLHEYPLCKDTFHSLHLYPALYFIERDFSTILGNELLAKLQLSLSKIREHVQAQDLQGALPLVLKLKMRDLFDKVEYTPKSSKEWADLLIGLQMKEEKCLEEFAHAASYWHPEILTSCHKKKETQDKYQPSTTLFDLFMGHLFQNYSTRALQDNILHLQACLIFPPSPIEPPHVLHPYILHVGQEGEVLHLSWGDAAHVHTLVAHQRRCTIETLQRDHEVELQFTLSEILPEEGEQSVEIAFFSDLHADKQIAISGLRASTFQLEDTVTLTTADQVIELRFSLLEGEGVFFGHLARANRPSQIGCKGVNCYEAYDWRIGLRTVSRSTHCVVSCFVKILKF